MLRLAVPVVGVSTLKVLQRFWGEVLQRRTLVTACFKDVREMSCPERRVPVFIL